jgi:predicted DNA-binding helix-hairpin-helix protein
MDTIAQLSLLNVNASLEAESPREKPACFRGKPTDLPITNAALPNGQTIILLKAMVTSACERDCYYCPFRAGRDFRRATFTPDDLARDYMTLYYAKAVEGLFLSSGIIGGGVRIQDRIIATAELLRLKYAYKGYIHAKIMPGADRDQVRRLMELADRVSLNLEAPNPDRLEKLAPKKDFMDELIKRLMWVEQIRQYESPFKAWKGTWPSSATQFVVGAIGETDLELISTSEKMYKHARLRRVYYSRFTPQADTPLEDHPAENPWRQHRLYQSSFLLRDYGFQMEELPFDQSGNLPLHTDPKLAWAQSHLAGQPVEVNTADQAALLRVPGIGQTGAERITAARKVRAISGLQQLKAMGIDAKRAAPFVLLNGKRPEFQLGMI